LESAVTKTTCEDRGQSLVLDWTQTGFNQDLELFGFSVELAPAEQVPYDAQAVINATTATAYGSGLYSGGMYSGGTASGLFILDISTLGTLVIGADDIPIEDRGRTMQITWSQSGFDQDMELFGYSIRFAPAEAEMASDAP
jgi:hypothetical protein